MANEKTVLHGTRVKDTLRLFWRYSLRQKRHLALATLLPIGAVILSVVVPFYASTILARLAQGQRDALMLPIVMLVIASAVGVICNLVGFLNMMKLQAKVMTDLNHNVFDRLLSRSVGFHADRISGKLVSDAIDFVISFATLSTAIFTTGAGLVLILLTGLTVVLFNSWQLGLFVLAMVVTTVIWAGLDSRTRSQLRSKRLVATKKLIAHLSDSIVNATTVKTFAQEVKESANNLKLNHRLQHLRINDWTRAGVSGSNRMGFVLAMQFLLILFVVHLTKGDPMVLATGIFAFAYTLTLTNRLFEISNLTRQVEESFLQASPMVEMFDEAIEITDKPGAKELQVKRGQLDIQAIHFDYHNTKADGSVFTDFSLHVKPGERVGLVGPSGGGKSTLTRLLLRFDDLDSGTILVDGQDIADVTQASLRSAIAYVPQEPLLFHRTIRENIAYGKPDATEAEAIAAAKKANAHDFVTSLADGYNTVVGERGVKLSGGQRQRIAIARAILKDAPILILDEATSALDSDNERQVQAALWELMKGRTAIVVAHRLSTIQRMDRIIVLQDGRIAEQGSHQKLLKQKGLYAKLWSHQSGGFLEE